jgi:hypothetical protein
MCPPSNGKFFIAAIPINLSVECVHTRNAFKLVKREKNEFNALVPREENVAIDCWKEIFLPFGGDFNDEKLLLLCTIAPPLGSVVV